MDTEYIYSRYSRSEREAKADQPSLAERIWAQEAQEEAEKLAASAHTSRSEEVSED